jgi:hypothetical protein
MLELSLEDTVFADPNPMLICNSKAIIQAFRTGRLYGVVRRVITLMEQIFSGAQVMELRPSKAPYKKQVNW